MSDVEVFVRKSDGSYELVMRKGEREVKIIESKENITRTYSPKHNRVLAIVSGRKVVMYHIPSERIVLEIPLDKVHSLEYARNEDHTKIAVAVLYKDGKAKVYIIEEDKITEEKEFDKRVSVSRENNELQVKEYVGEEARSLFIHPSGNEGVEKRKGIIEELKKEIEDVEEEIERVKKEIEAEEAELEKEIEEEEEEVEEEEI